MKHAFAFLIFLFPFFISSACDKKTLSPDTTSTQIDNNGNENNDAMIQKIRIKVGDKTFIATLSDNATATAFKALLPMTITMTELNGNEKYFDLPRNLPTNASIPSTIQGGDLMLYGSRTVVLFYKTFSTTYSYTKLGRVDDTSGLATALGSGNASVTFEIQ